MKKWEEVRKELLSDPATKREYDKLAPRYVVISELIEARIKSGLTQADVANKIGTGQSAIARFEGGNVNPSLDFLQKIAQVLGRQLTVHIT
jgi:predicted transcriptional regulator